MRVNIFQVVLWLVSNKKCRRQPIVKWDRWILPQITILVIPVQTGIQYLQLIIDSRWSLPRTQIRGGNDEKGIFFKGLKIGPLGHRTLARLVLLYRTAKISSHCEERQRRGNLMRLLHFPSRYAHGFSSPQWPYVMSSVLNATCYKTNGHEYQVMMKNFPPGLQGNGNWKTMGLRLIFTVI